MRACRVAELISKHPMFSDLPARGEVVAADDGQRLTELRAHRRRRAEHERRDQTLYLLL